MKMQSKNDLNTVQYVIKSSRIKTYHENTCRFEPRIILLLILEVELELFILQQGLNEHIINIHSESCCFITWMYFELYNFSNDI